MRRALLLLCVAPLASLVVGQERLPDEVARGYARVCAEQLGNPFKAQVRLDADVEKPCAVQGEGGGAMVIPARGLSAEKLASAGAEVVPVAELWLRKWTVAVAGKPLPNDRLRMVTINVDDKDRPMALLLLGFRKSAKGAELLVWAGDEKPLLQLPLKQSDFVQDLPVQMEWSRGETVVDSLALNILGKYEVVLPVARQTK